MAGTVGDMANKRLDDLVDAALQRLLAFFDKQDPDQSVAELRELLPSEDEEMLSDVADRLRELHPMGVRTINGSWSLTPTGADHVRQRLRSARR